MLFSKKFKIAILALAIALLLLLSWQFYVYFKYRGLEKVNVSVIPSDSSLSLDGKLSKAGTLYLKPGNHQFVASRQYFDDDIKDINTEDIAKGQVIYLLPKANSEEAKRWLAQHPEIQKERESAGGSEAQRIREILIKRYPIINKLPQETLHYKIDYSVDSKNQLELTISLYAIVNRPDQYEQYQQQLQQYKNEALQYLRDNGANPAALQIKYRPDF